MMRGSHAGLIAICLVAAPAVAAAAVGDEPDARELVVREALRTERRTVGVMRIAAAYPQTIAAGVGALFVEQPVDYDCATVCDYRGWLVQIEPGWNGAQLSAGYATLVGEKRGNRHFLAEVFVGFGVKGTVLRTWGDSPLRPEDQTLVGVEGEMTIARFNLELGVLRRISDGPGGRWVVSGGLGWGF